MVKKILIGVGCFIGAMAVTAGVCCMGHASRDKSTGNWFGNFKNLSEWTWKDNSKPDKTPVGGFEISDNTVAVDGSGNQLVAGEVYAMPQSIMFMSLRATSAPSITIRANPKPENADDQRVTWASSNDYYITVTPVEDDPLAAVITCIRPIEGEAVYVTCTSVDNPDAQVECRIDYLVSGDNLELMGWIEGNPDTLAFGSNSYTVRASAQAGTAGIGTALGTAENVHCEIALSSEFIERVDYYLAQKGYDGNNALSSYDSTYLSESATFSLGVFPCRLFYTGSTPDEVFNNAFKLAARDIETHATIEIMADYVYNGQNYGHISDFEPVKFNIDNIWIGVQDVELSDGNIVFGT